MLSFPHAKINLGLSIKEKRPDGYHDLETIFLPIGFKDALEIIEDRPASTRLSATGLSVPGDASNNLVLKAYTLLKKDFPSLPPLSVHLHKVVPMGAGLGGGSSDGTFMLKMLNESFDLGLSASALAQYALQLGSDCPFFLYDHACFASGRGEKLQKLSIPQLVGYHLYVICPDLPISTSEAFKGINPRPPRFPLQQINKLPIEHWRDNIYNDFEDTVFLRHPVLDSIKRHLYQAGASYASMSGTGSTIFGLFPTGDQIDIQSPIPFRQWQGPIRLEHVI